MPVRYVVLVTLNTVVSIYTPKWPEPKQQVRLKSHHFVFVIKQVPNMLLSYL